MKGPRLHRHHPGHWHPGHRPDPRRDPHLDLHKEHHGPPHWYAPGGLRHFFGSRLHRRLFFWFGASIFVTFLVVGAFRPRGLLYIAVPTLVVWILSGKIARRIARPLGELVEVSNQIGNGNLDARATTATKGNDEIAHLAHSVNDMAERIKRQMAGQRELLAAVSHELRTPLARMRVLLDIARDRGPDAATYTEWERELIEMDQLVGELLASARLDFQAVSRAPLDAIDVAKRALVRGGEAPERLVASAKVLPFSADPTLMARALANLIDNARKHGGGLRRLEVSGQPGWVSFAIDDGGPGIAPDIAARIFEPFVRGQGPGTASASGPLADTSLGLGLALVARIARAHGGRAFAKPLTGGGTRFMLELPTAPPA